MECCEGEYYREIKVREQQKESRSLFSNDGTRRDKFAVTKGEVDKDVLSVGGEMVWRAVKENITEKLYEMNWEQNRGVRGSYR